MIGRTIRGFLQAIGLVTILAVVACIGAVSVLGSWLQYEDTPEAADYIVVLAGDYHRVIKAAELYKQGIAPSILLSVERFETSRLDIVAAEMGYPPIEPTEYRMRLLEHLGVPRIAVIRLGSGHVSTLDEANSLKRYLGERKGTVIIVTSPYHARRAKLIFERAMPQVRWLVACPPEGRLPDRWWTDQRAARDALTEAAKLLFYLAGGSVAAK